MKTPTLFVCLGNSCRSIMAEALARHFCGARLEPASAGLHPLGYVAPGTIEVLEEMGVAADGLFSKGLDEVNLSDFRLIVTLTKEPYHIPLPPDSQAVKIHRPVADPFGYDLDTYRRIRDEIYRMLLQEMPRWL